MEDFIEQFKLPFNNFSAPIKWQDGFGFSVSQSYGDGFGSIYKIGIFNQSPTDNKKKITISVSYGKETDGGISLGTGKNGIWDPIDLNFADEFYYDERNKIFLKNHKIIEAKDILLYVEKIHNKPTKITRGFFLRSRLWFWRKIIPFLIKIFDFILIKILYLISGEKVENDMMKYYFGKKFHEKSNKKIIREIEIEEGKTMEFFGYHARRWSVVFYCSIHLFIYFFFFYLKNTHIILITNIGKNNFLSLCYIVVSFAITENLIPSLIKNIIEKTPEMFAKISFKSIKV